jgi:hypothetical protein
MSCIENFSKFDKNQLMKSKIHEFQKNNFKILSKKTTLLFLFLIITQWSIAQPTTVGLLYQDNNATEGYTLFTPQKNNEVYLVNNCGEKVKQWSFAEFPGATCYLMANGNLMRAGQDFVEVKDWNDNLIWSYATTANGIMQHHDIHPLPNGNVLCLVNDPYSLALITAEGRNPAITASSLRLEKIVEIQPTGLNTGIVVWQWKFKDHLVQDFDATKLNYGVVANHPELLDLNYGNGYNSDYIHTNSIDYNAALDQILISGRHLNEVFIIDHSTTTAQAASHSGGNSNRGGDFLWRWGNPQVYDQGNNDDRKLFLQHDAKWVESGYLDDGKITVFNNGDAQSAQTFSSVVMIQPEILGGIYTSSNNKFNPVNYDWAWHGSILGSTVYEDKMSGIHGLPNGNVIVSETSLGRVSEITKTGTLLWSYRNPAGGIVGSAVTIYPQFSNPAPNNTFFRAEKYPASFAGFAGHDLTLTTGILEDQNSVSNVCIAGLGNTNSETQNLFVVNPVRNNSIQFSKSITADSVTLFDINGRIVYNKKSFIGDDIEVNLSPAVYFMQIQQERSTKKLKIVIAE